jgi:hypothetical protein
MEANTGIPLLDVPTVLFEALRFDFEFTPSDANKGIPSQLEVRLSFDLAEEFDFLSRSF